MTGPEHWKEANLIVTGEPCGYGCPHIGCEHERAYLARAQVHATLALAAAFACARLGEMPARDADAWQGLAGTQPDEPDAAAVLLVAEEDSRRLDAIRGVLTRFDWEHDDRQLALEAIERIADGGKQ